MDVQLDLKNCAYICWALLTLFQCNSKVQIYITTDTHLPASVTVLYKIAVPIVDDKALSSGVYKALLL